MHKPILFTKISLCTNGTSDFSLGLTQHEIKTPSNTHILVFGWAVVVGGAAVVVVVVVVVVVLSGVGR